MNSHPSNVGPDPAMGSEPDRSDESAQARQLFRTSAHPQPAPKKILGLWPSGGLFHDRFAAVLRDHFVENPGR